MIRELYQSKENRDARFKELKSKGHKVFKSVSNNQLIHPQYIQDYADRTVQADNGIGNAYYKTHFPKLYKIEELMY